MLEEAIPSLWTSLLSWFTPTVFFVLLNVVIGTIAVTSKGSSSSSSSYSTTSAGEHHHGPRTGLTRAPSLVLDRLRSFNLPRYPHREIPSETGFVQSEIVQTVGGGVYAGDRGGSSLARAPSLVLERLKSFTLSRFVSGEFQAETVAVEPENDFASATASQVEEHEHYEDHHIERTQSDAKPPMPKLPLRMKKSASDKSAFSHFEAAEIPKQPTVVEDDGEVDAKADDFINKFRNQLKLQRLDSIMRYKEMLTRGAGH